MDINELLEGGYEKFINNGLEEFIKDSGGLNKVKKKDMDKIVEQYGLTVFEIPVFVKIYELIASDDTNRTMKYWTIAIGLMTLIMMIFTILTWYKTINPLNLLNGFYPPFGWGHHHKWLQWGVDFESIMLTIISLFVGAAITWLVSWKYYVKSGKELQKSFNTIGGFLEKVLENNEVAFRRDEHGNIVGRILNISSGVHTESFVRASATMERAKQKD